MFLTAVGVVCGKLAAEPELSAIGEHPRDAPADIANGIPAGLVALPQGGDPALAIRLVRDGATVYCIDS